MLYPLILFLIIIFHFINNFIWIKISVISHSGHDVFNHLLQRNTFYYNLLSIFGDKSYLFKDALILSLKIFNTKTNWPKLVYFISSVISLLFGNTLFIIFISTTLYFAILIISVYLIGKECAGKTSGILAAFLISVYPAIFGLSRSFGLDFPLTAMTALNIILLLRTNNFKNELFSIFFGLAMGLGILTKGQIIFFIAGPFCYILYKIILNEKKSYLRCVINITISFFIAVIISSIWWQGNIKDIFIGGFLGRVIPFMDKHTALKEIFTFRWLFFYFFGTIVNVSPLFFILFIIMLYSLLKSKVKYKAIILLWIIVPYIIFTVIYVKNFRFYLPSFPAIALASVFGITNLAYNKKKLVILFVVIWGLWQYLFLSYISLGFLPRLIKKGKIVDFYNDRDKLYYPAYQRWSDRLLNIANSFEAKMQEEASAVPNKRDRVVRISGARFKDEANPKYIVKILALETENGLCNVISQPQEYKQPFDFLIIGLKDKNIDKSILELQEYRPSITYRVIDNPHYFAPNYGKEISDFIFLLKAEKQNAQEHNN